ncbi:low temperature requirement protein A [Streptacidiphilus jiangxiensis]|uniref:Low temperature requirement protein LtrA n=1 Tax=Streptacidiphilus jiangxiensis TaxID=235985 RepID=A0A1H7ZGH9_STRJI|nr:low temperature requirement protein A [Streptacidiphilus jiangxiensis]SEM57405.1 Low temperature requirement protein LtrA [Streptacidiphilus jiangxiensis]
MTQDASSEVGAGPAESVRSLELFFDLVFVFTITQIATVLVDHPDLGGLTRSALLLTITWWMYGGYAWLTNALDLDRTGPRLLLLLGTAGFFVMSQAVPRAVGPGPWAVVFGAAYLVVVLVHFFGFKHTSGRRGILRIGPFNLASALVVLAAGFVPAEQRAWVWALACAMEWVTPYLSGLGGFTVGVGHFVERHGLAVIIVLGESITEVGAAASHLDDLTTVLVGSLLALAASAAMWWLYFDREEEASSALLERLPAAERPRAALWSFGYAYLFLIFGIAVSAVGMQQAIDAFRHPLHGLPAVLLPLGVALYLAGMSAFHRVLSGDWPVRRLVTAAAVLAAGIPALRLAGGGTALAVTTALLVGLVAWERRPRVPGLRSPGA